MDFGIGTVTWLQSFDNLGSFGRGKMVSTIDKTLIIGALTELNYVYLPPSIIGQKQK